MSFVNDALFAFVRKALRQLPDITFKFPAIRPGKVDPSTCEFTLPAIDIKSQSLLWQLQGNKPSLKCIATAFGNIGKNIRDEWREAAKEVGKNLKEDCCFHPLSGGMFCPNQYCSIQALPTVCVPVANPASTCKTSTLHVVLTLPWRTLGRRFKSVSSMPLIRSELALRKQLCKLEHVTRKRQITWRSSSAKPLNKWT